MKLNVQQRQDFTQDGFLVVEKIIAPTKIPSLVQAFDDLFHGDFETGVVPDEVNWQYGQSDPTLSRQICNGWKANRKIAEIILSEELGRGIAALSGWDGVRVMIDNVIWKPPGAKSLGYHQDSGYLSWFTPSDLLTCWIALDDTTASGGTIEFVRGSHRWHLSQPEGEFHAPKDYRLPMESAAERAGVIPEVCYVEVPAGGGSLHHGWTWHGSGPNESNNPRRALVLHAMRHDVQYAPENFAQGIGPIYSRYKKLSSNALDENYFPVIWRQDGYRTPEIKGFLSAAKKD